MAEGSERSERVAPQAAILGAALNDHDNPDARDYLRAQTRLADLQAEDLLREDGVRHWSLRIRHVSDVLKLGFELAVAFIVIAIAIGFGFEIWAATRADGLVIDAFTVPPAMAEKGLTGQVVASKLLDRLTVLQNETVSSRAASSFASDWTNDIKVEIPDTGVSLGQVVRFLHTTLGHESHLSGEMYQLPTGAALTVRMDSEAGQTFTASSGDLDALIQRAALAVYARAQPYRYSVYLLTHDKATEAYAASKALAESGPVSERPWGYIGLANVLGDMGRFEEERYDALLAHEANPDLMLGATMVLNAETNLGHEEAALKAAQVTKRLAQGSGARDVTPQWQTYGVHMSEVLEREVSGDYRAAADIMSGDRWFQPVFITTESAIDLAFAHDMKAAAARLRPISQNQLAQSSFDNGSDTAAITSALIAMERADWQAAIAVVLRDRVMAHDAAVKTRGAFSDRGSRDEATGPTLAILYARTGEWAKADAMLKTLPLDSDLCTRARGKVETMRRNWDAAAHWFGLVSARSPSIPFADSDWGRMLLAKGDLDGAIAKFESAHRKGPHYADPLEMWGEALIAKNRSDLALAKFEEADKSAPSWGRLHLEWGEALYYAGQRAEAHKQFTTAALLDLTPPEKSVLARMNAL
jgi:tetratricopeptide (TPR) repeat protein